MGRNIVTIMEKLPRKVLKKLFTKAFLRDNIVLEQVKPFNKINLPNYGKSKLLISTSGCS